MTVAPIEIVLLGQPRGKERPRVGANGQVYTPERTRSYEAALKYAALQVMGDRAPLDGPLEVSVDVAVPIPRSWPKRKQAAALAGTLLPTGKPDWDNYGKVIDALNLVVWVDDSQIVDGRVRKRYSEKPGLTVRVESVEAGVFG